MHSNRGDWIGPTAALLVTVVLGVWLRWALAGIVSLPAPFPHLRHAHSHMGYFGVLFPLAWIGWRQAGAVPPGSKAMLVYGFATVAAFVGFILAGYGPLAIVGCTLVAAVWLQGAWSLVPRMWPLTSRDTLAVVPLGVIMALACVPPIAIYLRRDPALAQGLVSTFLASLLFVVIVPSALAAARVSTSPWPLWFLTGASGALFMGLTPNVATRLGLLGYAFLLGAPVFSPRLALHARAAWLAVVVGLVSLAMGLLPNNRPVAIGAIHFLILGPVLGTLAPSWLGREDTSSAPTRQSPSRTTRLRPAPISDGYWWVGHLSWGTMSFALVAQGLGAGRWTTFVAAMGGTASALWWVGALLRAGRSRTSFEQSGPSTGS